MRALPARGMPATVCSHSCHLEASSRERAIRLADEKTAALHGLTPRARVVGMATAGVAPRIMGIAPAPATRKVLELTGLSLAQDVSELNEAFAAQGLAVPRGWGWPTTMPASTPTAAPSR